MWTVLLLRVSSGAMSMSIIWTAENEYLKVKLDYSQWNGIIAKHAISSEQKNEQVRLIGLLQFGEINWTNKSIHNFS